jgi:PHD/YefM family antitoxin component YafN of YafNO toxin-antitoxin module
LTLENSCHNIQTILKKPVQFTTAAREQHMSVHTYSSRDFTRDVSAAKLAASDGPVFITDRGRPAFALLKIEDYYRLAGHPKASLLELMDRIPGGDGIDFEVQRLQPVFHAADLG